MLHVEAWLKQFSAGDLPSISPTDAWEKGAGSVIGTGDLARSGSSFYESHLVWPCGMQSRRACRRDEFVAGLSGIEWDEWIEWIEGSRCLVRPLSPHRARCQAERQQATPQRPIIAVSAGASSKSITLCNIATSFLPCASQSVTKLELCNKMPHPCRPSFVRSCLITDLLHGNDV